MNIYQFKIILEFVLFTSRWRYSPKLFKTALFENDFLLMLINDLQFVLRRRQSANRLARPRKCLLRKFPVRRLLHPKILREYLQSVLRRGERGRVLETLMGRYLLQQQNVRIKNLFSISSLIFSKLLQS